jgi:hypothetical protein
MFEFMNSFPIVLFLFLIILYVIRTMRRSKDIPSAIEPPIIRINLGFWSLVEESTFPKRFGDTFDWELN